MARGLLGAGLAAVFAPAVVSCSPGTTEHHADKHPGDVPHGGGSASQEVAFDEVYRGRRLRGVRSTTDRAAGGGGGGGEGAWRVTVDGRPLHLMRRADGTYL
ncbi:tyrosinase family oxidase copper chaperone, partial [Streptomyces sp. H28]|uniref:tyrosinase family oxidase copper chaperone n=1 Tax=Streptomyces sp. H28 TaxID=2775865 RepID=UPI00298CA4D6